VIRGLCQGVFGKNSALLKPKNADGVPRAAYDAKGESSFRPVERNKSSCAKAFIGYVKKLPHPFTYLVRRIHSVARTRWLLAAITAATW